ncbi:MAG: hypothetical protein IID39_07265, partial [Planctomycetes bacterium]|nr:hypothetical protein [Planctomycetota bacterium]
MNTRIVPTFAVRMVLGAIVLGGALTALAQDAPPTAAEALDAAVLRYEEGDYVGARHALSQVDVQTLDDDGRDRHAQFLQLAEMAVRQQLQADLDQAAGLQALSDGRLEDAEALFQGVLANEFVSSVTRGAAEAELEKLAVQRAMESERPLPPSSTPTAAQESTEPLADELRSLRAKVLTRNASEAMAAGRLAEAERLFQKALSQVPGYPEAAAGLERLAGHELVESDARSLIDRI